MSYFLLGLSFILVGLVVDEATRYTEIAIGWYILATILVLTGLGTLL